MVGIVGCGIWSALMTSPTDYVAFVFSRWLGGGLGSAATTLGAGTIFDIIFLHQRGKAFTCYSMMTLFGTFVGPTFGGFIVEYSPWPIEYWWTVGVEIFVIILLFFLEETGFTRDTNTKSSNTTSPPDYPKAPSHWLPNRVATFFPGHRVVPPISLASNLRFAAGPFLIGICPVTLLSGIFLLIAFGWCVATSTLLPVFLQSPVPFGGYAFTPLQNAYFTFSQWLALLCAQGYGYLLNDRLPLYICQHPARGQQKQNGRLAARIPPLPHPPPCGRHPSHRPRARRPPVPSALHGPRAGHVSNLLCRALPGAVCHQLRSRVLCWACA